MNLGTRGEFFLRQPLVATKLSDFPAEKHQLLANKRFPH